jgi:hypothetical protein
LPTVHAR